MVKLKSKEMNSRRSTLVAALLLLAATCARGQTLTTPTPAGAIDNSRAVAPTTVADHKPLPFELDEELTFEGEFSKLLLRGIEIAEFRFTTERIAAEPATAAVNAGALTQIDAAPRPAVAAVTATPANFLFKGDAAAKGWFRKLFGVDFHFHVESVVDAQRFHVLRTTKLDEQGKRVRTSEAVFDRARNSVTWTERNPQNPSAQPRVVAAPLNGATHDFVSAIYFLRTQKLAPGQTLELVIGDSGTAYRVPARVVERKRFKTVVGKVQTLRLDLDIFGANRLVAGKGQMSLWFTDDPRHLPVRARVSNDLGTIDITLKKVSRGGS